MAAMSFSDAGCSQYSRRLPRVELMTVPRLSLGPKALTLARVLRLFLMPKLFVAASRPLFWTFHLCMIILVTSFFASPALVITNYQ
jgi:hypothetical protein